jgi:hypothetical protein
MKKKVKKMMLAKDTLRLLNDPELAKVGGEARPPTDEACVSDWNTACYC